MSKIATYTFKEEVANSLTHGVGILFGIVAIPIMIAFATLQNNVPAIVGGGIYGFCFLMLFTSSTLYHSIPHLEVKRILKILDHISIYFFIAGTYTPMVLLLALNSQGITILSVLWSLTALGIIFKILFVSRFKVLSLIIYLAMGWIVLVAPNIFFAEMPTPSLVLMFVGGGVYSIGVAFYVWKKLPYSHAVWHICVLGGSVCHYVGILGCIG